MANLLIPPNMQFVDGDGAPIVGTLASYIPGTFTDKTTWQNADESTANANPIVLDSRGTCVVYGEGDYRLILFDGDGNQVFDQLSSEALPASAISDAMLPVVGASTLAQARDLMGISAAIAAAISAVELMPGATGPAGPTGATGSVGPTGPAGSSGTVGFSMTNPGYILLGTYGTDPIIQFGSGSTDSTGFATVTFALPFPHGCLSVNTTAFGGTLGGQWANPNTVGNSSFQVLTSSPYFGGSWKGPQSFWWIGIGY